MKQELDSLACFVHGVLFALHSLGVVYNVRRRNWWDISIHTSAAIYDLWATQKHWRRCHED